MSAAKRRLTLDLGEDVHRQVKVAGALRRQTVREFCLQAIKARLRVSTSESAASLTEMTTAADPVLAQLWDDELTPPTIGLSRSNVVLALFPFADEQGAERRPALTLRLEPLE